MNTVVTSSVVGTLPAEVGLAEARKTAAAGASAAADTAAAAGTAAVGPNYPPDQGWLAQNRLLA